MDQQISYLGKARGAGMNNEPRQSDVCREPALAARLSLPINRS